ncbi:MAG: hypothetical protein Ta2E_08550 [Mycoplasmoidaceae bacterium]|nr:MAG: hypothetical protein Ta2E_08550 [Mycoplasmoidaceae bacterium]
MKNNLKEKTKLRCNDSPHEEDIGKLFEFENIIDKEKVHRKMKHTIRQKNSNNAPGWFTEWVHENKKEEMLYREQEQVKQEKRDADEMLFRKEVRDGFAKQEKFNADVLVRLDKIEKDVNDIKEDIDNIVKKNNLKR